MNIDELAFFDNRPNEFEMYETILDRLSRSGASSESPFKVRDGNTSYDSVQTTSGLIS